MPLPPLAPADPPAAVPAVPTPPVLEEPAALGTVPAPPALSPPWPTGLAPAGLAPAALASFLGYLHYAQGSATAIVQAQEAWGLQWQSQWRTLAPFFQRGLEVRGTVIDLAFTFAFLALVIAVAFRLRASYAIYSAAYLFFITMWGSLESVSRYGLGLFPAFMLLASLGKNPVFDRIYLPFSAALAALFMAVFAVWGWVA